MEKCNQSVVRVSSCRCSYWQPGRGNRPFLGLPGMPLTCLFVFLLVSSFRYRALFSDTFPFKLCVDHLCCWTTGGKRRRRRRGTNRFLVHFPAVHRNERTNERKEALRLSFVVARTRFLRWDREAEVSQGILPTSLWTFPAHRCFIFFF